LFRLVLESHDGRAPVPIPKRSTSTGVVDSLKALDPERPIREATDERRAWIGRFVPIGAIVRLV